MRKIPANMEALGADVIEGMFSLQHAWRDICKMNVKPLTYREWLPSTATGFVINSNA